MCTCILVNFMDNRALYSLPRIILKKCCSIQMSVEKTVRGEVVELHVYMVTCIKVYPLKKNSADMFRSTIAVTLILQNLQAFQQSIRTVGHEFGK